MIKMPKKTILHLTPAYHPHLGGVENHVARVCQELNRRGYKCQVITLQLDPSSLHQEKASNSIVYRLPIGVDLGPDINWWKRTSYKLRLWWELARHLNLFQQADVIQIHDVWWWVWPFRWFLPKSKLFMTFHGYEGSQNPDAKQQRAHQKAANMTQGNLCIGGFHEKWYGVKPTEVSFGAVEAEGRVDKRDMGKSEMLISTALGQHDGKGKSLNGMLEPSLLRGLRQVQNDEILNLIYAGRLNTDVGIMEYLQGLKEYLENSPEQSLHLDVFGSGPLISQAQSYSKRHNLPVKFHGWVDPKSLKWSKYDIALVSRHLAIIEALANGLPVIAHYSSPIKKDYLLLTPFAKWIYVFNDPVQFAKTIDNLNQLPAEAEKWASRQTWGKVVDLYEQLWTT